MRIRHLVLLAAAGVGAGACVNLNTPDQTFDKWQATLTPSVAFPDLRGQAAMVASSNGTQLGIQLTGAVPNSTFLWRLRLGVCDAPGTVVGTAGSYPELEAAGNGVASDTTHFTSRLQTTNDYHVEVRATTADTARILCGDMVPLDTAGTG
jgi:hypothetical protein